MRTPAPVPISTGFFYTQTSLAYALIFLLPTQLGLHFWPASSYIFGLPVDYLSPTFYLTDLLVILFITAYFLEKKLNISFGKKSILIQLLTLLFATSLLVALNKEAALFRLIKLVEVILLGQVLLDYFNRGTLSVQKLKLAQFKIIFSFSLLYTSLIALFQFITQKSLGGLFWFLGEREFSLLTPGISTFTINGQEFLRPYSTFSHPNSLAGYLLIGIFLLYPWESFMKKATLAISALVIILTWSQTVWLAMVFALLWIFSKKYSLFSLDLLKKIALIGILGLTFLFPFLKGVGLPEEISLRRDLSFIGIKTFLESPFVGIGLNNFFEYLPRTLNNTQVWVLQPVHNIFLLWLVETGIVGVLLTLWFFFRSFKDTPLPLVFWLVLITGAVDHYWLTLQQNILLFTIVFVLILKQNKGKTL